MGGFNSWLQTVRSAVPQRLGLSIPALVSVDADKRVHAGEGVGMLTSEHARSAPHRALQERRGLGVAALVSVETRQVVEARKRVGMLGAMAGNG